MNKKGHWSLGIFLGILFILITGYFELGLFNFTATSLIIIIGILLFYSILPDVDHKAGTMTWGFIGVATIGMVFGITLMLFKINSFNLIAASTLLLVFTFVSAHVLKHRGIIHTIQVGLLSVLPLWFLFGKIGYCILGYVAWHSHLIGDGYFWKVK